MFINDVGQSTWEEINDGIARLQLRLAATRKGATTRSRAIRRAAASPTGTAPAPSTGCAITGGAFYNPPTGPVPERVRRRLLLRRLLQRLDPPARPGRAAPRVTRLRHRHLRPGRPRRCTTDGSLYYLARGAGGRVHPRRLTANQAAADHGPAAEPDRRRSGSRRRSRSPPPARRRSRTSGSATAPTSPAPRPRATAADGVGRRQRRPFPRPRDQRRRQRRQRRSDADCHIRPTAASAQRTLTTAACREPPPR